VAGSKVPVDQHRRHRYWSCSALTQLEAAWPRPRFHPAPRLPTCRGRAPSRQTGWDSARRSSPSSCELRPSTASAPPATNLAPGPLALGRLLVGSLLLGARVAWRW